MAREVGVYVQFLTVSHLFIRMSVWPNRAAAAGNDDAKLPGARLAEDAADKLHPVLAESEFSGFTWWQEVTPEATEEVVATD